MNSDPEKFRIILASGSPRRKALMADAGYEFDVIIPDSSVEEGVSQKLAPTEFVGEASFLKAKAVAQSISDEAIVIGADTVAECDGQILGKPVDRDDARRMLQTLSGKLHFVHTGVTAWHRPSDNWHTEIETTQLQMAEMDDASLKSHLDSEDWIGKAGAFGFQDGIKWVQIVEGYESNVVGLPIEILPSMIQRLSD